MIRKNNQKGFTLLELLVVISIIGILIAIGSAAFSTAQKKGRDARRRADIKALQDGFEQYYAQSGGSYGSSCAAMNTVEYFPAGFPVDPKNPADLYNTGSGCDEDGYTVCALMETGGGNSSNGTTINTSGTLSYYCLTNLQ
jgi:prepilin-type N-terminal cleavage/methylation domain-containing protein